MLNKLKFNNLVISNKKGIQESRIQTINKLVHKIRKLKSLLDKHPDDKKCKERIRKSTETMELLKKIKRVDLMKRVLLMDKPASAVITNGIATPEEVAVALLSMNKIMQVLIKRFNAELELNAVGNVEWKRQLMQSSKRRQKIERTEEKRRKRLQLKEQKAMGRKRQEWLEENQHAGEDEPIDADFNVSTTNGWKIEQLSNDISNDFVEKIEKRYNDGPKNHQAKLNTEINKEQKIVDSKGFKEEGNEDKKKNIIKRKANTFLGYKNESYIDTTEGTEETLAVDPFFVTGTGENYMATAIIKKDNFVESSVGLGSPYSEMGEKDEKRLTKKIKWTDERDQRNTSNNVQKKRSDKFSQNKWNNRQDVQINQGAQYKKNANRNEKNLHPSWVAKQKIKPIITGFQGKKIKFENDEFSEPNKLKEKRIEIGASTNAKTNKSENDLLHPSWAAKQKLKPSIIAFQGKKIIFDADE